jgi:hypothetical protein
MGDFEVAAFVRNADNAVKRAYESGQRALRPVILRMISQKKKGASRTVVKILEQLWEEIAVIPLPAKLKKPKKKRSKSSGKGQQKTKFVRRPGEIGGPDECP